jgi:hypothetical protein
MQLQAGDLEWGLSVNKWSVVMWGELTWFMWSDFVLKWSEVSCGEVLRDKSAMYITVTLYWGYLIVLWLFYLVCILYCGCFNWFCNMWVCVCVGFVMCGCVYVWVFWRLCGCCGNMCTCIYSVLYCFVYVYLSLFVTSVRTTSTEWKLNCSK